MGVVGRVVANLLLNKRVEPGDMTIELESTGDVEPGQLIYLSTQSPVDSRGYKKVAVALVSSVEGRALTLNRQMDFYFDIAETSVTVSEPARAVFENVEFVLSPGRRFDFRRLSSVVLRNCSVVSPEDKVTDGLFIGESCNVLIENMTISGGRYPVQITNGTYNATVNNLYASGSWHPIDASVWASDVFINNANAVNCDQLIQCHPAFNVWFRHCKDVASRNIESICLRCIGGGIEDCEIYSAKPPSNLSIDGARLRPEYHYLASRFDRTYRRVKTNDQLSASFCRKMIVEDCEASGIVVDGYSFKVGEVEWRGVNNIPSTNIRRCKITSQRVPIIEPESENGTLVIDRLKMPDAGQPWAFRFQAKSNGTLSFQLKLVGIWEHPYRDYRIEVSVEGQSFSAFIRHKAVRHYAAQVLSGAEWLAVDVSDNEPVITCNAHILPGICQVRITEVKG